MTEPISGSEPDLPVQWAKVIDNASCIGCHACTTACKSENEVPLSVTRTYVKYVDVGIFPQTQRAFQVTRCNQCADAPCTTACPTRAMYRRDDGIVDFDKSICIGCKACIAACPQAATQALQPVPMTRFSSTLKIIRPRNVISVPIESTWVSSPPVSWSARLKPSWWEI